MSLNKNKISFKAEYKAGWTADRVALSDGVAALEAEEQAFYERTQTLKKAALARGDDTIRAKIFCVDAARRFLSGIFPQAARTLAISHGVPVAQGKRDVADFLPWLTQKATEKVCYEEVTCENALKCLIGKICREKIENAEKAKKEWIEKCEREEEEERIRNEQALREEKERLAKLAEEEAVDKEEEAEE